MAGSAAAGFCGRVRGCPQEGAHSTKVEGAGVCKEGTACGVCLLARRPWQELKSFQLLTPGADKDRGTPTGSLTNCTIPAAAFNL